MANNLLKNPTLQWDRTRRPVIVNVNQQKHHVIEHALDWNIMSYASQPAVEAGQNPLEIADVLHIDGGGFKFSGGHIGWRVELEQEVQPEPGQYHLKTQFTPDISMMDHARFGECVEWRWVVSTPEEKIEGGWHTIHSGNHKTLQRFEQVVEFGAVRKATIGLQFRAKWGNQAGEIRVHAVEALAVQGMETDWIIPSEPIADEEADEAAVAREAEIAMRRKPLEERMAERASGIVGEPALISVNVEGSAEEFQARAEALKRLAAFVEVYDARFAEELHELAIAYLEQAAQA